MSREFCSLRWDVFFLFFFLLSRTQLPDSLVPVALDRVPPFCFQCRSFVSLAQHHVRAHTHTNLFLKRKKHKNRTDSTESLLVRSVATKRWSRTSKSSFHFIFFFCRARRLQFIVLTKIRPEIGAQNLIELTGKTISIRVNATFELSKFVEKTRNDVIPKFSTFEGLAFICL